MAKIEPFTKDPNLLSNEFPQHESICYLNHAAVSPWPLRTQKAVCRFAEENVTYGATHYPEWMTIDTQLRRRLAALINAPSHHDIALSKSTSEALSIIAYGIEWHEGDEIIITNQEFPSNRMVWETLATKGVKLVTANIDNTTPLKAISSAITSNTRLVSVSSVQYASGLRLDIDRLGERCAQDDILFCVDAIQSIGAIPFNLETTKADFVVADGHKWMMGPEGLALLYVNPKLRNHMKLYQYGWHMVEDRGNYDTKTWRPAEDATRFECGSPNTLGAVALNASLSLIEEIGLETINDKLNQNIDYLIELLKGIPDLHVLSSTELSTRAGIVTFEIGGIDSTEMYRSLMKRGVICANRGGGLRLSPHFYTPKSVMERAIDIIKSYVKETLNG